MASFLITYGHVRQTPANCYRVAGPKQQRAARIGLQGERIQQDRIDGGIGDILTVQFLCMLEDLDPELVLDEPTFYAEAMR
jgi:hypothetical protein